MVRILSNTFSDITFATRGSYELVDMFSGAHGKKHITVWSHIYLSYLIFLYDSTCEIIIDCRGNYSSLDVYILDCSGKNTAVNAKIYSSIQWKYIQIKKHFLSFLGNKWSVSLDGSISVDARAEYGKWQLSQDYLLFWRDVHLETIPGLSLSTSQAHISHGCRIFAFDEYHLFYLLSRGLSEKQSKLLLVDSYLAILFSSFPGLQEKDKEHMTSKIYSFIS